MLKFKNVGILIKQNSKLPCLCDRLRTDTFRAHRKSLRARNAHAYEHTRNFVRPANRKIYIKLTIKALAQCTHKNNDI